MDIRGGLGSPLLNNIIGGTTPGAGNIILNNAIGVCLFSAIIDSTENAPRGNAILSNSIFTNLALPGEGAAPRGIVLSGQEPASGTVNDPGDIDAGPNDLQNYPELAVDNNTGTLVATLNSAPNTSFLIQFFSNTVCDSSGFGKGETFLGSVTVTTDNTGNATFAGPANGQFITATATDPNNNTSEFSNCVALNRPLNKKLVYYALGDSVASGHGLPGGDGQVLGTCRRSPQAYPYTVDNHLVSNLLSRYESVRFSHLACSGGQVFTTHPGRRFDPVDLPEQVQQVLGEPFTPDQVTLISITIGADDLDFVNESLTGAHLCRSVKRFEAWRKRISSGIRRGVALQLQKLLQIQDVSVVLTDYFNPYNQQSHFFKVMRNPLNLRRNRQCDALSDQELYARTERVVQSVNAALSDAAVSVGSPSRVAVARLHDVFRFRESAKPICGDSLPEVQDTLIQYPTAQLPLVG